MLKLFIDLKLLIARLTGGLSIARLTGGLSIARLTGEEEGQGLTEYALILTLIVVVAILALTFLGGRVTSQLSTVGNSVTG